MGRRAHGRSHEQEDEPRLQYRSHFSVILTRLHAAPEAGIGSLASFSYAIRYPGCVAGCIVALPIASRLAGRRVSIATFADTMVVSSAVGLAIFRVGYMLHGCCYGIVSSVPCAAPYRRRLESPRASAPRVSRPLALALAIAFWPRVGTMRAGNCFLAFLVLHDGGKFVLEGLRAPEPLWHLRLPSLMVATGAGIVLASRAARRRSAPVEGPRPGAIGVDSSGGPASVGTPCGAVPAAGALNAVNSRMR